MVWSGRGSVVAESGELWRRRAVAEKSEAERRARRLEVAIRQAEKRGGVAEWSRLVWSGEATWGSRLVAMVCGEERGGEEQWPDWWEGGEMWWSIGRSSHGERDVDVERRKKSDL